MKPLAVLWEAMNSLPKPVTYEAALECGMQGCYEAKENREQFKGWFETNGDHVLSMLNGQ